MTTLEIQRALIKQGFLGAGSDDGKAGPATTKAIKAFQVAHGLAADGQVGPLTAAALGATKTVASADASEIMTPIGIAVLKAREGVRLTAYRDSVGVPTIGYGHIKGVALGQRITQAQADALFLEDLAGHALPILSCLAVSVADHERDALISIAFNIGVGGFRRSGFLQRLNAGDRAGAAEAILAWRKPPEILSRRQAEYDQFRTPYAVALPRARRGDARPVSVTAKPSVRRARLA